MQNGKEKTNGSNAPGSPNTPGPADSLSHFGEAPTLRIPEAFIVLSSDQRNGEKVYPGTVGLKYGPAKEDWIRLPYTSMKKLIDFCKENSVLFNYQLKIEREKNQVSDL